LHLSIVTGTYNRLRLLQALIISIRNQMYRGLEYEIIIVDGGSTDGTLQWCKEQSDVKLIEHGELRGAIKAFCDGAKIATGDYVVMANDDVTFHPVSLLIAMRYLDTTPSAGAVAFADNRYDRTKHQVMEHPARLADGSQISAPYAQVGMFRRWLGEAAGWWGADDRLMSKARTYGGDNYLSSRIWEMGYTINPVEGCKIHDVISRDDMRQINGQHGVEDSAIYYTRFKGGAVFNSQPIKAPELDDRVRILYLPIFEGHKPSQFQQKRGLRDALGSVGTVIEYDYLRTHRSKGSVLQEVMTLARAWKPDILFTQCHSAEEFTIDCIHHLRSDNPAMLCINWNGDYWPDVSLNNGMVDLLAWYDLALVVNLNVVDEYEKLGIPAAYWQCAFEQPPTLPDMPAHDVLFLANAYSEWRQEWGKLLKSLPYNVGIYGSGWLDGDGDTLYDFATSQALMRNAKICVGDNQYNDGSGFVSNRMFEGLGAGAFMLHQKVNKLMKVTGLRAGVHFAAFDSLEDLPSAIEYWMANPVERETIRQAGYRFAHKRHTFDVRVKELFTEIIPAKVGVKANV